MFLQSVQRLRLIQNLVELERKVADNDLAMALMLANQCNRRQGLHVLVYSAQTTFFVDFFFLDDIFSKFAALQLAVD